MAPAKKPIQAPAKAAPVAGKAPTKPTTLPSGKPMPPTETAPLAALANATSKPDGKIISILEVSGAPVPLAGR